MVRSPAAVRNALLAIAVGSNPPTTVALGYNLGLHVCTPLSLIRPRACYWSRLCQGGGKAQTRRAVQEQMALRLGLNAQVAEPGRPNAATPAIRAAPRTDQAAQARLCSPKGCRVPTREGASGLQVGLYSCQDGASELAARAAVAVRAAATRTRRTTRPRAASCTCWAKRSDIDHRQQAPGRSADAVEQPPLGIRAARALSSRA